MREMNAQRVTVTMRDGTVFRGFLNIGSCRRLSDFFRKPENTPFIVMFDTMMGQSEEKRVYFLNMNHIQWIEPNELEEQQPYPHGLALENE